MALKKRMFALLDPPSLLPHPVRISAQNASTKDSTPRRKGRKDNKDRLNELLHVFLCGLCAFALTAIPLLETKVFIAFPKDDRGV
jgi:hypothetical protein